MASPNRKSSYTPLDTAELRRCSSVPVLARVDLYRPPTSAKVIPVSDLSDRLAAAKNELGISSQRMSDTAQDAGYQLSNYSATVYTNGKHPAKASAATLEALAYVLRVPLDEVRELAGMPPVHGKFDPAPEADTLTAPQRTAVNEIIRLLADGNQKAGGRDVHSSMNRAEGNSADSNVHQLHETPVYTEPPPAESTAALHGENRGRKIKEEQDRDAESPDVPGDYEGDE